MCGDCKVARYESTILYSSYKEIGSIVVTTFYNLELYRGYIDRLPKASPSITNCNTPKSLEPHENYVSTKTRKCSVEFFLMFSHKK